ncbi:hypothetical protein BDV96DRAFT_647570 [Lophiotrema nucula]|uniref:DUF952 domain protein n=1 Tax=Lophiotrema nucula TaxID=690887 RepID=A0A6A5Z4Y9_9PLEO|nr:hypothetical protein BDV96DRAFT_647570 [Lophiotrema nucula]
MPAPSPLPTYLYKILPSAPPSPLPDRLPLSDLDSKDGFIHLSTAEQTASTLDKYFGTFIEIWLLKINRQVLADGTDGNGSLKAGARLSWEDVSTRGCFPHLYEADLGVGNVEDVIQVQKKGSWEESLKLE